MERLCRKVGVCAKFGGHYPVDSSKAGEPSATQTRWLIIAILFACLTASAVLVPYWRTNGAGAAPGRKSVSSATTTLSGSCVASPAGLINWWTANGAAIDVQGTSNGLLRNGATLASGKIGKGFSVDGTDDYVKLPDNFFPFPTSGNANAPFTFNAWFKTSTGGVIFGQQAGDPFASAAGWVPGVYVGTDGKLRAQMFWKGFTDPITSAVAVNDGVFHHLAVTYDGTTQTLYLDGVVIDSKSHTQNSYYPLYRYQLGTGYTAFWPAANGGWFNFNGIIDEVEIFDRALTQTEIQSIVDAPDGICVPADSDNDGVPDSDDICPVTESGTAVNASGCPADQCVVVPSGLISWWSGDGTAEDLQGANHGTLVNGTVFNAGQVGPAFVFDGVDDRVNTNLDAQPSAMPSTTWDAWVYPVRYGRQTIFSTDSGGYERTRTVVIQGGNFGVFTGSGVWQPVAVELNQWQHIAVVYTPTNIEFYKDGVGYSYGAALTGGDTTAKFTIGNNPTFHEIFQGRIDEVEVFDRALAGSEILAIANAGAAGKCKPAQPPRVGYIVRTNPNPTNATSVQFHVTFTQPVVGVYASSFTVNSSGSLLGAVVTNISGSGAVYTLTVGEYLGTGEIHLDVLDNDSIVDGSGTPLGGTGAGNGDFTIGEYYTIEGADITTAFVVTKTADTNDRACSPTDCSLREAILAVNADPNEDTIQFNIPASDPGRNPATGVFTISVGSGGSGQLPALKGRALIDGYSQPGASPNTNPITQGTNGVLLIELNGANAGIGADGLTLAGSSNTIKGLVINQFGGSGIIMGNGGGNLISGNFIGLDDDGSTASPNGYHCCFRAAVNANQSDNNVIGGPSAADRNVISGNAGEGGIRLFFAGNTRVKGNIIGLKANGTDALGNNGTGIGVGSFASGTVVGGPQLEDRNIISANGGVGVFLQTGHTLTIQNNYIGTDVTGTLDRGNAYTGIGSNVTGNVLILGNLISGNRSGIDVSTSESYRIKGNLIGTQADGVSPLGNSEHGVNLFTHMFAVEVGGVLPGEGNVIAFNGRDGVSLTHFNANLNLIRGNSIFSNGGLGIDLLDDGVTPNDAGDGDTGGNNQQNSPLISVAVGTGSFRKIEGTLNSNPNRTYIIDFYLNPACDESGRGEGKTRVGEVTAATNGDGNASFNFEPGVLTPGQLITATATDITYVDHDNDGNTPPIIRNETSEFSPCQVVVEDLCANVSCFAIDQCHDAGICDSQTGLCSNPNRSEGSACNDGNGCTRVDTCQAGTCVGDDEVTCTADQCHEVGTCDPQTGACSSPPKADGSACNDGDGCTRTDTCQAGVCVGDDQVVCTAPDQCHDAGACDPMTGVCSTPPKADGSACNDGDGCTRTDTCQAGVCVGDDQVVCTAPDQCHDVGTCDPMTGVCSTPPKANDTPCDDGNACTPGDTCQSGTCTAGPAKVCTAPDQCHDVGSCDPQTGHCSNPPRVDGSACDDGNGCTQTDTCQSGVCAAGASKTCTASDQCHDVGSCDPQTGNCSNPTKTNGSACDDGDRCTSSDSCQTGTCTPGTAKVCTASDQCHDAGSCDPMTGACSNPALANGTVCSDGNGCTQTDTCQTGTCTGSNPVVCAASDQCHTSGSCDPSTGACSNPPKPNGTACDDGDSCTGGEACQLGSCTGGVSVCTDALQTTFVIGDRSATLGSSVTFWGSQWSRQNSLSGSSTPSGFKGFATSTLPVTPGCGGTWKEESKGSGPPSSVPEYIIVLVASSATKSGSTVSGNVRRMVVVRTDSGYDGKVGNAGTGTVVSVNCGAISELESPSLKDRLWMELYLALPASLGSWLGV